jgi:hypothetical protein
MSDKYLLFGTDIEPLAKELGLLSAKITATTLNVREIPSTDSAILKQAAEGDSFPVLSESDGWTKVQLSADTNGYISSQYASIGPVPAAAVDAKEESAALSASGNGTSAAPSYVISATEDEKTPLRKEMDYVSKILGIAVCVIAVVVLVALAVLEGFNDVHDVIDSLLLAVSLAVAAVPEGLAAILTVVLALGVQRMAAHNAIVKKLHSVETLGSASVICSDKTGTLTRNEMTVERVVTPSGEVQITGTGYAPEGRMVMTGGVSPESEQAQIVADEVVATLVAGTLANDGELREENGRWEIVGDERGDDFIGHNLGLLGFRTDAAGHNHAAFRRVTGASDLHFAGRGDHTFHGHLVAGQRTGLIRADHGSGSQGLHRMQFLDDGVVRGHTLHTKRQHHGQDGGQAFRHGGHSQRDSQQQGINHVMDVVEAFQHGERHQHHDSDDAHRNAEDLGDVIHLLPQRSFLIFGGGDYIGRCRRGSVSGCAQRRGLFLCVDSGSRNRADGGILTGNIAVCVGGELDLCPAVGFT